MFCALSQDMKTNRKTPLDEIIFHEAGHAVAALDEEIEPGNITVSLVSKRTNVYFELDKISIRSQLILLQAGTAAQIIRIFMRDWDGKPPAPTHLLPAEVLTVNSASDAQKLKRMIGGNAKDPSDNAIMVGCLGAAIRYVTIPERWGKIEILAAALRLRSEINGREAAGIIAASQVPITNKDHLFASQAVALHIVRALL